MGKVIYIAGPIGNGHTVGPREMYANVRRSEEIMYELMDKGWSVICPHLSYHCWLDWPKDMPWENWMRQDFDFIKKSDAFFYMTPELYGPSKGAKLEFDLATKLGMPIYTNLLDVPEIVHTQTAVSLYEEIINGS